jgi:hypothetical protein
MNAESHSTTPGREKAPWFQVAQALFVAGLVVALFFLGLSMVHHRFVQGGRIDRYGHIKR